MGADRLAVRGQTAGARCHSRQHGTQIISSNLARQTEAFSPDAGLVVVQRLGNPDRLVGLLADTEFGDAEHPFIERFACPRLCPPLRPRKRKTCPTSLT